MNEIDSWQNGKYIKNSKIGTKIWDAHYMFGHAVFDAFRTYNHKPHLLYQHISRLYRSAKLAEIEFDMLQRDMKKQIKETMEHNKEFFKNDEYRFMIYISPGYFRIYDDMGVPEPIITINPTTTSRYASHIVPHLDMGVTALISSQVHIPSRFLDPKIKSCSRLHYGIAEAEASRYGKGIYPILLDEHGYITESSGASVGFIKDGNLCLPKDSNILQGCTMKFIESLTHRVSCKTQIIKDNFEIYDIINSDGIIFSGAFVGILPCYNIIYRNKKHTLEGGKPTIDNLKEAYSKAVGVDVEEQWRKWY